MHTDTTNTSQPNIQLHPDISHLSHYSFDNHYWIIGILQKKEQKPATAFEQR